MKGENPRTQEFQAVWRSEAGYLEEEILWKSHAENTKNS